MTNKENTPKEIVGLVFDTDYEKSCIALTNPDENDNFLGLDSDKVECSFSLVMVTRFYDGR